MNYNIIAVPKFSKELKKLAKKYPSLRNDFKDFLENLEINPFQGILIGKNCFKIRLSIKSKGKGKSGGARVITTIIVSEKTIFLLAIYDKSEKDTLTDKELTELLQSLFD
jgi:mRNA-degrading endonuclease RelE of RelBE toxin-antitoxin system